jgi:hypothetical protein
MSEKHFYDRLYYNSNQVLWRADPKMIYGFHLESILSKLADILGDTYHDFRFVVYDHQMHLPLPDFKITGQDVILIFLADENSTVPLEICDKFFAIFKAYYPLEENVRNILAFPIGYSNSASLTRFIPFKEREYFTSYAGNFLGNRLDFYRQFTWLRYLPPFPINSPRLRTLYFKILTKFKIFRPRKFIDTFGKSICYWSGGFAKGLSRDEYATIISETKIALCPKGFRSTECFRLLETMRLGCVIVSDELPPSRWYKDSPIIVETDWLNIGKILEALRSDPEKMLALHQKTLEWWENVCSDEAVAQYLADGILRLKSEVTTTQSA